MKSAYARLVRWLNAIASWRGFYAAVWIGCAVPLAVVIVRCLASPDFMAAIGLEAVHLSPGGVNFAKWIGIDPLGVDPVKALLHETGEDGLGVLLACLAVTPIRRLFKVNPIQKVRRSLGVWAFAYAFVHVCIYLTFDQLCYSWATCDFGAIGQDILKRKFIFMGLIAFTIMTVLAITSTTGWVRRLKKKWQTLHRLVYVAAVAAIIHFIWIQKADISEPLMWAGWLALFFVIRVYLSIAKRRNAARAMARSPVRV